MCYTIGCLLDFNGMSVVIRKKRAPRRVRMIGHPHDAVFQKIYKNKEFVKEIVAIAFDEEDLQRLDLSSASIKESAARNIAGKSRRPDLVISIDLKGGMDEPPVTICIVFEFKAHRAHDVILQIKEYHTELCHRTGGIVIPIVLLCCKDENFDPPSDYNSWVFRDRKGETPVAVQAFSHLNPNFFCRIINLHKLPASVLRRAKSTAVVIEAIRRFLKATEDDVALLLEKARQIPAEHKGIVMIPLIDYYEHTDKGFSRKEFDRIEREHWPNLHEKERLMPTIEFSLDQAEERGIELGRTEGIELGRTEGIGLGRTEGIEQKQRDVAARMLARGMSDEQIRDVLQLSAKELAAIKQELNN